MGVNMNLLEFENKRFPETWNKKTIKELKEHEPPKGTGTIELDPYYCWQGSRIPKWFE